MTKEEKFYKALQDIFIGAEVEGKGGFINLMRIKSRYYSRIQELLRKDVEDALVKYPDFRDELFDKLYTFFSRYFSESGSIYFNSTPFHNNIYEKVYTDERDVVLFWKTQMLYYVKTDRIFRSMPVEIDEKKYFFDASTIETKKANEKRALIYELQEIKDDNTIRFSVFYSEKGRKTKTDDILKTLRKNNIKISEDELLRAFRTFEKQAEVDFFINKNAKAFLQEQFKLWSYQYFWEGGKEWTAERINELQILKDIAYKIIDFISQFEDELVKIWNKPKFVKNSNYVITLDRILSAGKNVISNESSSEAIPSKNTLIHKIVTHKNINQQIEEWKELGFVGDDFNPDDIFADEARRSKKLFDEENILNPKYKFLPVDTKYFKELEPEILSLFDDLDEALNGWLIKSENYQALNTLLPKFKEKIQTIYIDPPFNLDSSDQFLYRTNYKDANWATLLENRLRIAKDWLNEKGSIFVRCDYNGNWIVRLLLEELLDEENFRNEIVIKRSGIQKEAKNKFLVAIDSLFYFTKSEKSEKKELYEQRETDWLSFVHYPGERKINKDRIVFGMILKPPKGRHWGINQDLINELKKDNLVRFRCKKCNYEHYEGDWKECNQCGKNDFVAEIKNPPKKVDSDWTNIQSYSQDPDFPTRNAEELLKRVIEVAYNNQLIILDFFLGSGTTTAVAHKLGRKWLGVEMGEHFYNVVLPRMKKVLFYDKSGISKEKDVKENYNEKKAGGFFKYYELEQYEETLANCKYEDGDMFTAPGRSPYQEYVFLKDEKLLNVLEIDYKNRKVNVDLDKIYNNIDIAETLSNLTGKWIKQLKIENEKLKSVVFEDGSEIDLQNLDYKLIKPLIWWE